MKSKQEKDKPRNKDYNHNNGIKHKNEHWMYTVISIFFMKIVLVVYETVVAELNIYIKKLSFYLKFYKILFQKVKSAVSAHKRSIIKINTW